MALDYETQQTLGVMAGTLATWVRANRNARDERNEQGEADADAFGMYSLATAFLRMYHELLLTKSITPPTVANPTKTQ